ncbi:hypothetical protein LINPERHAP1_LOCUS1431 [Linum perenne]
MEVFSKIILFGGDKMFKTIMWLEKYSSW